MLSVKGGEELDKSYHFTINGNEVNELFAVYPQYDYAYVVVVLNCEKRTISGYIHVGQSVKLSNNQLQVSKKPGCLP